MSRYRGTTNSIPHEHIWITYLLNDGTDATSGYKLTNGRTECSICGEVKIVQSDIRSTALATLGEK